MFWSSETIVGATLPGVVVDMPVRIPATTAVEMSLDSKLRETPTIVMMNAANATCSEIAFTSVLKNGSSWYLRSHAVPNATDCFQYRTAISFTDLPSEVFDMDVYNVTESGVIEIP